MNSPVSHDGSKPIICVVGARPNFMKMAPIMRSLALQRPAISTLLVHTGQHYDNDMSDRLFRDLSLPKPDINLAVGSGTHAVQTAEVMRRFEPVVDERNPSCVVVVGDVNSTLACTLVAVKKGIPVAHVEAGLRSHDRTMPEEINRVLTDQVADRLYTTERAASENLLREGISGNRISFVGNVMIDSLMSSRRHARDPLETLAAYGADVGLIEGIGGYGVVTLHRPSNVDDAVTLRRILEVMKEIAAHLPLIFALHPRTRANISRFGLQSVLDPERTVLLPPQGYLEMLGLTSKATVVLTDSGGLQEETTALGVPCLTLRENTERPITIDQGTNVLVGTYPDLILKNIENILADKSKKGRVPELWDGRASERIVADLLPWIMARQALDSFI